MSDMNRKTSSIRPPGVNRGDAPECEDETSDHIFRFGLTPPAEIHKDEMFRWIIEEQLRALLEIVELADNSGPRLITSYRFRNEGKYKELYPVENGGV